MHNLNGSKNWKDVVHVCDLATILESIESSEERRHKKIQSLLDDDAKSDIDVLPESLLREDDIFPEYVSRYLEEWYCKEAMPMICHDVLVSDHGNVSENILSTLDHLTNTGLSRLGEVILGGPNPFANTRAMMKKVIKEKLFQALENGCWEISGTEIQNKVLKVVNDPQYHRATWPNQAPTKESQGDAVDKVLTELEGMPLELMIAMLCILGNAEVDKMSVKKEKQKSKYVGMSKGKLLRIVKRKVKHQLKELSPCDELPESLSKAMEVANLWLKTENRGPLAYSFLRLSRETWGVKDEVVRAIQLLEKVKLKDLKSLKEILDPKAKGSRNNKQHVRNRLMSFLFKIGCDESVPCSINKALEFINGATQGLPFENSAKDAMEEEKECILNLSAVVKQVLWDYLPEDDYDQEFADAYMEDIGHSDFADYFDISPVGATENNVEGTGCNSSIGSERTMNQKEDLAYGSVLRSTAERRAPEISNNMNIRRNKYLAVQDAADKTSLVAHRLIGKMVEGYVSSKGRNSVELDVIVQVVQEVMPDISDTRLEKIKLLLSLEREELNSI